MGLYHCLLNTILLNILSGTLHKWQVEDTLY